MELRDLSQSLRKSPSVLVRHGVVATTSSLHGGYASRAKELRVGRFPTNFVWVPNFEKIQFSVLNDVA